MYIIAGYLTIIAISIILVAVQVKHITIKGSQIVCLNLGFLIIVIISQLLKQNANLLQLWIFMVLTSITIPLAKSWIVFKISEQEMLTSIEKSLTSTLSNFQKSPFGYEILPLEKYGRIRYFLVGSKIAILTITNSQHSKKVSVIKKLLYKQFTQLIPRLKIKVKKYDKNNKDDLSSSKS